MKITTRLVAAALTATIALGLASGCKKGDFDDDLDGDDYAYTLETTSIEDIEDIQHLVYSNDKLFFASTVYDYSDETLAYLNDVRLYTMNTDGTEIAELSGYTSPAKIFPNASGHAEIRAMHVDSYGNIWIFEYWELYRYDVPEGIDIGSIDNLDTYRVELDSGDAIRKLGSAGAELFSVDTSSLIDDAETLQIQSFNLDGNDNLYICAKAGGDDEIYILDDTCTLLFKLNPAHTEVGGLLRTADGSIAYTGFQTNFGSGPAQILQSIDFEARALGEAIEIPLDAAAWQIYPAIGEYAVTINDNICLYGLNAETGEAVRLLNWLESGVPHIGIGNVIMLSDELILCTGLKQGGNRPQYELLALSIAPYSESSEGVIMLTLATIDATQSLNMAVAEFNAMNPNYRIQVVDYSEFNVGDDQSAGLLRLNTEIIAGNVPDILDMSGLPYMQYVSAGLLVDVHPLIDSDPTLSRSDLVESVFRAVEVDGGLYQIFPTFGIDAIVGNPAILGSGTGWNMDEFMSVLNSNPNADAPLGQGFGKTDFLSVAIIGNIDEYVDLSAGTTHFDTASFIQLLEFVNTNFGGDEWLSSHTLIPAGRQIMTRLSIFHPSDPIDSKMLYGEIVCKGFPSESRNGPSVFFGNSSFAGAERTDFVPAFAITTRATSIDGAWNFLRLLLDEDYQMSNYGLRWIPTNRAALEECIQEWIQNGWIKDSDDVDQVWTLINSVSGASGWNVDTAVLLEIISESAEDYFNGQISAEDAARIIQSRASIYVSERS